MITKTFKCALFILLGFFTQFNSNAQILGDGNIISQTVSTTNIEHLDIHSMVTSITINQGSVQSIALSGDSNILTDLVNSTSVDTFALNLPTGNTYSSYTLNITITTPNIKSIRMFAEGEVTINNFTNTASLNINNLGNANFNVNEYTNATSLYIQNNGEGNINMNEDFPGITNYKIFNHGGGNVFGCGLATDSVLAQNFGSGDIHVASSSYVNGTIFGSGSIYYYGTPTLYQNNFGSGNIGLGSNSNCTVTGGNGSGGNSSSNCIEGNGSSTSLNTALGIFEHIKLMTSVESITVQQGTVSEVMASGDQNIVDSLEYLIINDTLFIQFTGDSCYINYNLDLTITTADLNHFIMMDSGVAFINEFANANTLTVNNHGAGNISIDEFSNAYTFKANNYGPGNITVNEDFSFVSSYTVNNYGAGNYNGCQLNVASCYANNYGSGTVTVTASGYLNAEISGSGNIEYYDIPTTIDQTITGTGNLIIGTDPSCTTGGSSTTDCIEGDGTTFSYNLALPSFDYINLNPAVTSINLVQGTTPGITVSGDNNIIDSLQVEVINDTLYIAFPTDTCYDNYVLDLNITATGFVQFAMRNSGNSTISGFDGEENVEIINYGTGNITVESFQDVTSFLIENYGTGNITIDEDFPNLTSYNVNNYNSGNIYGCELTVDTCIANNHSTGSIIVSVESYLIATIQSTGNIEYYGSPVIDETVNGTGNIIMGTEESCLAALNIINHESNALTLSIYPNPSNDIINISNHLEMEGAVYNTFGQKVLSISANQNQIDVCQLNSGNYFVKIGHQIAQFVKAE